MSNNPYLRVEHNRGSADRLVDLCTREWYNHDHIVRLADGLYQVDLPPDVKAVVVVHPERDPYRPSRRAHSVYIYRNDADRQQGTEALINERLIKTLRSDTSE